MSFLNNPLLEKEIKAVLGVLDELDYEFKEFFCFKDVRNLAEKIIIKNKNDIIKIMHDQDISPRRTACSWINNVSGNFLESGQYHVYRGVLNHIGKEYLKIFDKSTDMLFEVGDMSKERAEQHKQDMRKCIQGVG